MPGIPQLDDFLARLRAERARLDAQDWTPPAPPEPPDLGQWRLRPVYDRAAPIAGRGRSIEFLRRELPDRLRAYLKSESTAMLLVKVPPGVGKTHAASLVAQEFARGGQRGLWCGQRHNMFAEIQALPHFEPARWYHWQPISGQIDGAPACRHADYQGAWTARGYSAMDLCWMVCKADGHLKQCPYRRQEKRRERLIFAQHQHLVNGLAIDTFKFAIVDELPLSAFVAERVIRAADLDIQASGPVGALITRLIELCGSVPEKRRLAGKDLLVEIGPLVEDALAAVEINVGAPQPPRIYQASEALRAPYWYVYDLLELLDREMRCWLANWPAWNESVWLTRSGLHLLQRAEPWEKLPAKLIVLDATAQPDLYHLVFKREVETYAPEAERVGKLYQVAGRQNGKSQAGAKHGELTPAAQAMLEAALQLTKDARQPGVVCWKALKPFAEKHFTHVLTFGGLRGSNHMEQCDVVVVMGTYTPHGAAMLDAATAITGELRPFYQVADDGQHLPVYRPVVRAYRLTEAGLAHIRQTWPEAAGVERQIGEYAHPALRAIHAQLREAELVQAIHRARINVRKAEVWLLTSTPTDEALDGLYQDPPIGPAGIPWAQWTKIKPWLDERRERGEMSLTKQELADFCDVSAEWVRKSGWMKAIADSDADRFEIVKLEQDGRGPKPDGLRQK